MAKRKKLKGHQLDLLIEDIKIGDRVDCPLGKNLSVYWVSPVFVWVMVTPTMSKPVYRHEVLKVGEVSNA